MSAQLRLVVAILLVLGVFVVGTAGYWVIDGDRCPTLLDAAYMTVITVSTVGYSEQWELSRNARLWTLGVIGFGVVTVSYAFTSLVTLFVGGELRSLREKRKMQKTLEHANDHVIVCGFGRMGSLIAEDLRRQQIPVVVVDAQRVLEVDLREAGVPFIIGDATEEDVLLHAGLMRARALVIALPSDADSVYVTLTAHTLQPDLMIVSRAEVPATEAKLVRAGASRVVCPQVIGAMKVFNILTRPSIVDFMEVANKGVDLEMDEVIVSKRSPIAGCTLREANLRQKTGATVVAIKKPDGKTLINPTPDATLGVNDTLILVGPVGVSSRLAAIGESEQTQ